MHVLEWYLACVAIDSYDRIRESLASGRELVNPIDAFEQIIRNNQPIGSYKSGLLYAHGCFPEDEDFCKEATRWMLRWEPELTKQIGRVLIGEAPVAVIASQWPKEKHIAYALLSAQMMSSNWENPRFVARWTDRLSYRDDLTTERRQHYMAQAYLKQVNTLPAYWQPVVLAAIDARVNPVHRSSLDTALQSAHAQLQQRLPSLPSTLGDTRFRPGLRAHQPSAA